MMKNPAHEDFIIDLALQILEIRLQKFDAYITSPEAATQYLKLKLSGVEHEVFAVLFLNNRHAVIAIEEMFRGTIDGAAVYPREVVKAALKHNAAAVLFAHNHPSGIADPSPSDHRITTRLVDALALIDVRVLDHVIIGGSSHYSFSASGLL